MGILDKMKNLLTFKKEYHKEVKDVTSGKKLTDAQKWENTMHVRRKHTLIAHRRSGSFVVAFPDGEFFQCSKQLAMTYTINPFKLHK